MIDIPEDFKYWNNPVYYEQLHYKNLEKLEDREIFLEI